MKLEVTVCDVCKDYNRPTKRYEVKCEGRRGTTDRCEEHGEVFEDTLGVASKTAARRRSGRKIVTLEEIEQMKQA